MRKSWKIHRRTVLRGLGASLALPCLDIMRGVSRAEAAAAPPVRLACLVQPNGVYPPAWEISGEGRDFRLTNILQRLEKHKQDLIVISNLDNAGVRGHVQMTCAFLTGVQLQNGRCGVSLDQMVAQKIGGETPLPSVELGTEPPRQGNDNANPIAFANTCSWSSPTTRLNPEINPRVAFDRLFRNQNSPEAQLAAADRKSIVDLVLDDANSLRRKASSRDQQKLDEYLQSVRSVETQIDRTLNPPRRSWTPPTQPSSLVGPPDGIPARRDEHLRLMMDLLVLAFWTDTTRVGTLMMAHGFSRQAFSFLPGVTSDHHGMSHHKNEPGAVREYTTVSRWYIEQFAWLIEKMKVIDEGNGSLLDNTVLLYGSEMKDGNGHVRENLPIILAGRGGGRLPAGQHIALAPNTPLSNLHLTLAQKFGCEIDSFNGTSSKTLTGLG
jgi:uncharacterized protein DUF1552